MRLTGAVLAVVMSAALAFGQAKPEQKPEKQKAGGKNEGIKVHGHWVLEIKNPDGSLASRHEFENSLVPGGYTATPNQGIATDGQGQGALV